MGSRLERVVGMTSDDRWVYINTTKRVFQLAQLASSTTPGGGAGSIGTYAADPGGTRLAVIHHPGPAAAGEEVSSSWEEDPSASSAPLGIYCFSAAGPGSRGGTVVFLPWTSGPPPRCLCFSPESDFLLVCSRVGDLTTVPTSILWSEKKSKAEDAAKKRTGNKEEPIEVFITLESRHYSYLNSLARY